MVFFFLQRGKRTFFLQQHKQRTYRELYIFFMCQEELLLIEMLFFVFRKSI